MLSGKALELETEKSQVAEAIQKVAEVIVKSQA